MCSDEFPLKHACSGLLLEVISIILSFITKWRHARAVCMQARGGLEGQLFHHIGIGVGTKGQVQAEANCHSDRFIT